MEEIVTKGTLLKLIYKAKGNEQIPVNAGFIVPCYFVTFFIYKIKNIICKKKKWSLGFKS